MANEAHLQVLRRGQNAWNAWRRDNPGNSPDLTNADLRGKNLVRKDLVRAILTGANLYEANLYKANLSRANLTGANLSRANLTGATFNRATLNNADLTGADLSCAVLVKTGLENANLTGCRIYGISAWDVALNAQTRQSGLIITQTDQPLITVDNLDVAQFIYLLLNNEKLRHVIDTITSKVVLILGRFTDERKAVIDAIRADLRRRDFTPVVFDFDKPDSKDLTGTVEILARMARFIIADLTDPRSVPQELGMVVPYLRTTPVLPLKWIGSQGYGMFQDLRAYPWVLPTHEYADGPSLILALPDVIGPANRMADEYRRTQP
jgi:uncharacterized protein YjbI with pentapeptide repeats